MKIVSELLMLIPVVLLLIGAGLLVIEGQSAEEGDDE